MDISEVHSYFLNARGMRFNMFCFKKILHTENMCLFLLENLAFT